MAKKKEEMLDVEENETLEIEEPSESLDIEESLEISEDDVLSKKEQARLKKEAKLEEKRLKKERSKLEKGLVEVERIKATPEMGLTSQQVKERKELGLDNNSKTGSTKSIPKIIFTNVFTFFNLLTLAIAGWLISVKAFTDLFFLVIVTMNVVIGIIQEIKAKNIIDKLSLISAPTAFVMRDGIETEIPINEVVLDDILILESGKQIPSDAIVLEGSVEVNESLLTGESDAIVKKPGDILYSGSFVISGNCKATVDKVGKDNYIEQLSGEAKSYKKPKSDLMRSLKLIIIVMAIIIIPVGLTLFYMQITNGADYVTAVRKSAGAMIGMIPSGLFLLSSVALAVGVIKLGQNNVMVQELYCIEMLARVNVLCLDKTGTITDGTMSVKNVVEFNSLEGMTTKNIISSMLYALKEKNLTSIALADKFGTSRKYKSSGTIPFSSQRKYNAVSFDRFGTFILGAPEFVMKEKYELVKKDVERYAADGYRVLLLAHKDGQIENNQLPNTDLMVISMVLIEDNIRPDAIKTIQYFKQSGVEVKVISGDNPLTVAKISERAGISGAKEYISLDGLTDAEVERAATKYTVFGRVSPNQKRILIRAMKAAGKTVAMTGDGVNDILALKESDCSIAVASGSEAARNVSHLVLLDSNFDSMPKVVAEGRRVINNVAGVACLFLTKTIFSFLLAIQAINSGGIYPISTNQLIMIDFLVTGIPSFFLVLEPNNREVDGHFLRNIIKGALPGAITILICSMIAFQLVDYLGLDFATSSTIIVIVATHTSLMVLFKVCHPFNIMRKIICGTSYTLFVIAVIFLPNFFEFRPLFKFMEYYSDKVVVESIEKTPTIEISKAGYYVVDGYITKYIDAEEKQGYVFGSTADGKLIIDDTTTDIAVSRPIVSVGDDYKIYLTGYKTGLTYNQNSEYEFVVKNNGSIILRELNVGAEISHELDYSVMPIITKEEDRLFVNGKDTGIVYKEEIKTVEINPETWKILINGSDTVLGSYAQIEKPALTIDEENGIVVGAKITEATISQSEGNLDFAGIEIITNTSGNYVITVGEERTITDIKMVYPNVETSVANRYVIDGKYTEYKATQVGGEASTNLTFDDDRNLIINGVVTNYKVNVTTTQGGMVQRLSIPAILLLLMLILFATPLMRLLQRVVPFIKSTIRNVQILLSKI